MSAILQLPFTLFSFARNGFMGSSKYYRKTDDFLYYWDDVYNNYKIISCKYKIIDYGIFDILVYEHCGDENQLEAVIFFRPIEEY